MKTLRNDRAPGRMDTRATVFVAAWSLCWLTACVIPLRGSTGTSANQNNNQDNHQNNDNQNGDGSSSPSDGALDAIADAPADARSNDADAGCDGTSCRSGCPDGQTWCTDRCTGLSSDPANCGVCDQACPDRAHSVAVCADGGCAFVCARGAADCDLVGDNGCEVDLATDRAHCGRCGQACVATDSCRAGVCASP